MGRTLSTSWKIFSVGRNIFDVLAEAIAWENRRIFLLSFTRGYGCRRQASPRAFSARVKRSLGSSTSPGKVAWP